MEAASLSRPEESAARSDGDDVTIARLVDSIVGNQPLNKQPLLIAGDLERELLSQGWPAGLKMGGEPALALRYGVGRDVLREVIRLLEARDHARMRRGPGGGLEIIRPDLQDLIARMRGYAHVTNIDRICILETWVLLQTAGVRALVNQGFDDWDALSQTLTQDSRRSARAIGDRLIAASPSRILAILGRLIAEMLPSFVENPLFNVNEVDRSDMALPESGGGPALMNWLRQVQLPLLLSRLQSYPLEYRIGAPPPPQSACFQGQAMQLAHDIMSEIPPEHWARGVLIGNEFDLADRFGVDKSVVRQAIRLMEDAETATSLPGRGRGLVTRLPSTAPLSRLLCAYFVAHEANVADGECMFVALRLECAGAAADRSMPDERMTLLAILQDLDILTAPVPVSALQCFERLQQHTAHNSLLTLFIDAVKAFLTWRMAYCPVATHDILKSYKEHTHQVVAAICAGNREDAIDAESRKLEAMARVRSG